MTIGSLEAGTFDPASVGARLGREPGYVLALCCTLLQRTGGEVSGGAEVGPRLFCRDFTVSLQGSAAV